MFDLHEAVAEDGHTTNANRCVAVLSNLLKFAVQASKIAVNPCPGLTKYDETQRDRKFLPKECPTSREDDFKLPEPCQHAQLARIAMVTDHLMYPRRVRSWSNQPDLCQSDPVQGPQPAGSVP